MFRSRFRGTKIVLRKLSDYRLKSDLRMDFEQIFLTYEVVWFDIVEGPSNLRFNDDDFERFYNSKAYDESEIEIRIPVKDNLAIAH